ncbi:MAG: hypothetical protein IID09_05400 [Candidatus Hydrogenedentes bacterium]|nr:hypothetical protein [Candidatus Hydrogenedentota bacterium]
MQRTPCHAAAFTAVILMLGALSGCASTDSSPADLDFAVVEPELDEQAEVVEAVEPVVAEVARAPEVVMCYLGLEFSSKTMQATTVRVDVDGNMMALVGAGDKMVVRYAEGMHGISVALPKASNKKREKNTFAVELKPFTYTKIVIEELGGKKSKKRLIVRIFEDGEEVRSRTIEL